MAEFKQPIETLIDVAFISMIFVTFGHLVSKVRPTRRGFYCQDESIRHAFQPETVTIPMVVGLCLITTFIAFVSVESTTSTYRRYVLRTRRRVLRLIGLFMFGLVVTLIITEVIKLAIGRLRPHFIDVCHPLFDDTDCSMESLIESLDELSDSVHATSTAQFVEVYVCNATDTKRLINARKSFPSGHASISFFMTTFLSHYFDNRFESPDDVFAASTTSGRATLRRRVTSRLLQLALWITATGVSVSRVTDKMHHMTDVIAGAAVGLVVALWTVTVVDKYFEFNLWLANPIDDDDTTVLCCDDTQKARQSDQQLQLAANWRHK